MAANPPIAATSSAGGIASAANPPVEVTLVIPDPDNPGGWIPDPGGGGGSTTLAGLTDVSVAGAADGQVLGFRQSDGKWVPLAAAVGTVTAVAGVSPDGSGDVPLTTADIDSLTEAQINALVAAAPGAFKGAWSFSASYKAGDFVVYQDDIYRAINDIDPPSAISYIGLSSGLGMSNIALPAGTAVGDVVILSYSGLGTVNPAGSGWSMLFSSVSSGYTLHSFAKFVDSGDIANGFINPQINNSTTQPAVSMRFFRGAGMPTAPNAAVTQTGVPSVGTVQVPGWSPATGASVLRVFSMYNSSGSMTGTSSMAPGTSNFSEFVPTGGSVTYRYSSALVTPRPIATADGTMTMPTISSGTISVAARDVLIPPASGFNPGLWTKIQRTAPKRVAVADVNYASDGTEDVIAVTSITTARTITLPAAANYTPGRILTIKDEASLASWTRAISVATQGGELLDGLSQTIGIIGRGGTLEFYSNGSAWFTRGRLPEGRSSYTSNTTLAATDTVVGVGTTSAVTMTLPSMANVPTGRRILIVSEVSGPNITISGSFLPSGSPTILDPYGWVEVMSTGSNWLVVDRSQPVRRDVTKVTASLATNASETGTVVLGKGFRLLRIASLAPARVELYATAAQMTADAGRASGVAPTGDHGVLLDWQSATGALGETMAPAVEGQNMETSPTNAISYRITNLNASTGTVTVTFTVVTTEF